MENELLEAVEAEIAMRGNTRPVFAVFDFDNTCIVNDIAEATLNHLAERALFRRAIPDFGNLAPRERAKAVFKRYYELLETGDIKGAYAFNAQILAGWAEEEIPKLVEDVIVSEGPGIGTKTLFGKEIAKGLSPRPQVLELIGELERRAIPVWIISASPQALVVAAMKRFGIAGKLIGVRNKIENGVMTADLEKPLPIIEGKIEGIKSFISVSERPLLGVGDSGNDLPMLEYSHLKVVVDRGNSLARKARGEGWFLLSA